MVCTRRLCVGILLWGILGTATVRAAPPTEADLVAFRTFYQEWNAAQAADKPLEALAPAEKACAELMRLYGDKHAFTARVYVELGALQSHLGRYKQAEATLTQGLTMVTAAAADPAAAHEELGAYYEAIRDFKKAESHLEQARLAYERRTADKDLPLARLNSRLALTKMGSGQLDEAQQLSEKAVAALIDLCGADNLETLRARARRALVQIRAGDFIEVEREMTAVLDVLATKFPENRSLQADALMELANSRNNLGGAAAAGELFARCRDLRIAVLGPEHPLVGFAINNLGNVYKTLNRTKESKELYVEALRIKEAAYGRRSIEVVKSLQNLGIMADREMQFKEAEAIYDECVSIARERLGPDSFSEGSVLWNVYVLKVRSGRIEPALVDGRRALQILEKQLGSNHPDTVKLRSAIALLYGLLRQPEEAEKMFTESIDALTARYDQDHPAAARLRIGFAAMLLDAGKLDAADEQAQSGLASLEKKSFGEHPDAARAWAIVSRAAMLRNDAAAAVQAMDRSRRVMRKVTANLLPMLSEGERLRILHEYDAAIYPAAVSIAADSRVADDPAQAAVAAGWVLNGKGIAAEASLRRRDAATDRAASPVAKAAAARLIEVRTALMKAALPSSDEAGLTADEVRKLSAEEEALRRRLANETGTQAVESRWVELQEATDKIPTDGVLVEFVRAPLHTFDPQTKETTVSKEPHYAAWIIYPTSEKRPPDVISLGPAKPIDERVAFIAFHTGPLAPRLIAQFGENRAEAALQEMLAEFARRSLGPVLLRIEKRKHWIISPDAELWLVPWSAMILSEGRYAIQDRTVMLVTSGRDLVLPRAPASTQAAVIVADPDYGGGPAEQAPFRNLPGSRVEADAIAPMLKDYTKQAPRVLLRGEATEENLIAVARPSVLHLSTHGFYLPIDPKLQVQPLARTGLALAGANLLGLRKASNDGILTGLEAADLDLHGTKLVVLSACETGIGKIVAGEGVDGLRKAFHHAGAETVLSTLWSIPDQETAYLVTEFFRRYSTGISPATALRDAQLATIVDRRTKHGGAHPLFWGAFVATSSVPPLEPISRAPELPAIKSIELAASAAMPLDGGGWAIPERTRGSIWQPDGRVVLLSAADGRFIFDPKTQALRKLGGESSQRIYSASAQGNWLTMDRIEPYVLKNWRIEGDAVTSQVIAPLDAKVVGLVALPDGKSGVAVDAQSRIHLLDLQSNTVRKTLQTQVPIPNASGYTLRASLSADGSTLAAFCKFAADVVVVDLVADRERAMFCPAGKPGYEMSHSLSISPDGRHVVVLSSPYGGSKDPVTGQVPPDCRLRLFDANTGTLVREFTTPIAPRATIPAGTKTMEVADPKNRYRFHHAAILPDGQSILAAGSRTKDGQTFGTIFRYRLDRSESTLLMPEVPEMPFLDFQISLDGKWAAVQTNSRDPMTLIIPIPALDQ